MAALTERSYQCLRSEIPNISPRTSVMRRLFADIDNLQRMLSAQRDARSVQTWWAIEESNPTPTGYEPDALTD